MFLMISFGEMKACLPCWSISQFFWSLTADPWGICHMSWLAQAEHQCCFMYIKWCQPLKRQRPTQCWDLFCQPWPKWWYLRSSLFLIPLDGIYLDFSSLPSHLGSLQHPGTSSHSFPIVGPLRGKMLIKCESLLLLYERKGENLYFC